MIYFLQCVELDGVAILLQLAMQAGAGELMLAANTEADAAARASQDQGSVELSRSQDWELAGEVLLVLVPLMPNLQLLISSKHIIVW